jgi:hypothetical protein
MFSVATFRIGFFQNLFGFGENVLRQNKRFFFVYLAVGSAV